MQEVDSREFFHLPARSSCKRGKATRTAHRCGNGREQGLPDRAPSMDASNCTPATGESVSLFARRGLGASPVVTHSHRCGHSCAVAVAPASRAARESPSRSERSEREYGVSSSAERVPVTHLSSRRTDASLPRRTGPCLLRPFAGSILLDSGSRRLLSFGGLDCCPQFSQGSGCENLLYRGCNK
mgnify:CR=1 FL=1